MLPAAAQGAIGIEIRAQDEALAARLQAINHAPTFLAVQAERAFLAVLDGSCHSPIGGHMTIVDGRADMRGLVLSPDGREAYSGDYAAAAEDAVNIGRAVADEIRAKMPDAFVDAYLQEH
jgi:hydroxymethylbilane synthase